MIEVRRGNRRRGKSRCRAGSQQLVKKVRNEISHRRPKNGESQSRRHHQVERQPLLRRMLRL